MPNKNYSPFKLCNSTTKAIQKTKPVLKRKYLNSKRKRTNPEMTESKMKSKKASLNKK